MRILNLIAVVLLATCFVGLSAEAQIAQSTQPAQQTPAVAQAQVTTTTQQTGSVQNQPSTTMVMALEKAQQDPQKADDRPQTREAFKVSPETLQRILQEARERGRFQPYRLLAGDSSRRSDQPGSLDQGIYVSQLDGANVCGSIVSYNFSQGDNPVLHGVTTCTPWNAVASKRANGPNLTPQGPQVRRTVFQGQEKKRPD